MCGCRLECSDEGDHNGKSWNWRAYERVSVNGFTGCPACNYVEEAGHAETCPLVKT